MSELNETRCLVTGASRGIGRACALELARGGARVALVARTAEKLEAVAGEVAELGGEALVMPGDLSDPGAPETILEQVVEAWDGLDVLVNNAGMLRDNLVLRMADEDVYQVLEINLMAAFRFIRGVARPMMRQRSGRIINISSIVGIGGNAGQANYAASKAGLIGLTKSVAKELASRGITCNAVAPGFVETAMTADLGKAGEQALGRIPLKRFGQPEDVAPLVRFLAGPGAAYITGAVIPVCGGLAI